MRLIKPAWMIGLGVMLVLAALLSVPLDRPHESAGVTWGFVSSAAAQETDPAQLELGAQLYNQNCAICHGENGQGRIGATLAQDWPSIQPELTIETTIANGIAGSVMPAWSQAKGGPLTDEEIAAIAIYILSWQTSGLPKFTPAPTATLVPPITPVPGVEGDPNAGAVLFAENCAACHGDNGQGRIGATLAQDWPGIRPDLSVKGTIATGIRGSAMPAWSQENGGPLSDADINNLVAFIMSLPAVPGQAQPTPTPTPAASTFLAGWGGVLVFVVLIVAIILIAIIAQRRKS
jgi:cytochrome c oxidase cbb3-type subunit 3